MLYTRPGGLITDDTLHGTVECVHGKTWPEGDRFEDVGGRACRECCEASRVAQAR